MLYFYIFYSISLTLDDDNSSLVLLRKFKRHINCVKNRVKPYALS
jgi:hypothetical protein